MLALWRLLWFSKHLYINKLWVFSDSKVLINHLKNRNTLAPEHLSAWIDKINDLRRTFTIISFTHIFKKKNMTADRRKQKGLKGTFGEMHYELIDATGYS